METVNPNDIRLAAMNLLARREHLGAELTRKLRQRFGAEQEGDIESVVRDLAESGLVCDRRFTETYLHSRCNRGFGPDRLRQELRQKGVPGELLDEVMAELDVDWVQLARSVRDKKFGVAPPADFRERARQMRFLAYRGFNGAIAAEALGRESEELEAGGW